MKNKISVYAVIRLDGVIDHSCGSIDALSIVSVLESQAEAQNEVCRLNELNQEKGCRYFFLPTRYYPEGKAID